MYERLNSTYLRLNSTYLWESGISKNNSRFLHDEIKDLHFQLNRVMFNIEEDISRFSYI